jgi:amidase
MLKRVRYVGGGRGAAERAPVLPVEPGVRATTSASGTTEEAVEIANRDVVRPPAHDHGVSRTEAYRSSGLVGRPETGQVLDRRVTARNAVPSEYRSVPY